MKEGSFKRDVEAFVGDAAKEMAEMNELGSKLELSSEEIQRILGMNSEELSDFLREKGIDFEDDSHVRIVTPEGESEAWMYTPEEVLNWLKKVSSN